MLPSCGKPLTTKRSEDDARGNLPPRIIIIRLKCYPVIPFQTLGDAGGDSACEDGLRHPWSEMTLAFDDKRNSALITLFSDY